MRYDICVFTFPASDARVILVEIRKLYTNEDIILDAIKISMLQKLPGNAYFYILKFIP